MPTLPNGKPSLRQWSEIHIGETFDELKGHYEDVLFHECVIKKVTGATFKNCCFSESKFDIQSVEDMQDVTMGLDCAHFSNVEFSEKAFDFLALLLVRTRGNTAKRLKIIEALGGKQKVSNMLNEQYPGNRLSERAGKL